MSKKIKVIVKEKGNIIGEKGSIINVSYGYAFNYLIPKNIAELATKGKLKHAKMFENIKSEKLEESKKQANIIILNLAKISKILIKKKSSDKQIFGKVNEKEILNKILDQTGHKLDKKQINIPEIKQAGIYTITIHILNAINTNLKLQILSEEINSNL